VEAEPEHLATMKRWLWGFSSAGRMCIGSNFAFHYKLFPSFYYFYSCANGLIVFLLIDEVRIDRHHSKVTLSSSIKSARFANPSPNVKSTIVPFFEYTNSPADSVNVSPPCTANLIHPLVT
jgi:hypothetical protein